MEYLMPTVVMTAATIAVALCDSSDRPYETNYLVSSDNQGPQQGYQGVHGYEQEGHGKDYYAEPHYAFAYEVHDDHTGDIKAHKEERKGDHTQGMYMLVEPNGSKRIVEYVVLGKSGFNAKVHQSKSQAPQGGHTGHSGYVGGHQSYFGGHTGYTGGHGGHSGYTGGHNSYTEGHAGHGYTGGYNSYTGGHAESGYTGEHQGGHAGVNPNQNIYTEGSHALGLGDYSSGHYYNTNKSPYKVQETTNYNYKPPTPSYNLQPFKPLIPYSPSDPQSPKSSFPYNKPLLALYRPQTSYKPVSLNKPTYKFVPTYKQSPYDNLHSQTNDGHATSSVSFSSHGSKIASKTNHVVPQQKRFENKH